MKLLKRIFEKSCYLILLLVITFSYIPLISTPVFAYPSFPANLATTRVVPWADNATAGVGNIGVGMAGVHYKEFLTYSFNVDNYTIRQAGTITSIRIFTNATTSLTGFYLEVWRMVTTPPIHNFNLIGKSENIVASLVSGGFATINLSTPISGVQPGDMVGYRIETSGNVLNFHSVSGGSATGVNTFYLTDTTPSTTNYSIDGGASIADTVLPIELYMSYGPQFVFVGDSIMRGNGISGTSIPSKFSNTTGYTYQNLGISGNKIPDIVARFNRDVISENPRVVVIEGGINDIRGGDIDQANYVSQIKGMLDTIQATASIEKVYLIKMLPCTSPAQATTYQMQKRDQWNASLVELGLLYSKVGIIDGSNYIGLYNSNGPPENLWDIIPANTPDGIHLTDAGNIQMAQAIANQISSPTTSWYSTAWLYRKKMTLISASAVIGNPTFITVNRSAGVDSGNMTYVGTKCNADYSDIRFTASDGMSPLGFEINSYTAASANITVDLPYISTTNSPFYMYYGNAVAPTYNNGALAYIFYDGFERGINGNAVGGTWISSNVSSYLISTAQYYLGTRSVKQIGGGQTMYSYNTVLSNITLSFRWYGDANSGVRLGYQDTAHGIRVEVSNKGGVIFYTDDLGDNNIGVPVNSAWSFVEIKNINWVTATYDIYYNNVLLKTAAPMKTEAADTNNLVFASWGSMATPTQDGYIDEVIYTKGYTVMPTWGAWGTEQNYPNAPTNLIITSQSNQITASWTKGVNSTNTLVRYKGGSYPTDITDGTQVYYGTGSATPIVGLSNGVTYYVRTWGETTTDGVDQYSSTTRDGTGIPGASGNTLYSSVVMAFIIAVGAVVLLLLISVTNVNDAIAIGVCGIILIIILMSIWLGS